MLLRESCGAQNHPEGICLLSPSQTNEKFSSFYAVYETNFFYFNQNIFLGVGAQQLRALAVLAEDLS